MWPDVLAGLFHTRPLVDAGVFYSSIPYGIAIRVVYHNSPRNRKFKIQTLIAVYALQTENLLYDNVKFLR